MSRFPDRAEAGRELAGHLKDYREREDVVVLGLARGGVPVAYEVARALQAPLDVFLVRKLGVPGHEELAMGAIASGGVRVLNEQVVQALGVAQETLDDAVAREQAELERRERDYRDGCASVDLRARTVLLVDDGLATGSSMRAALEALAHRDVAQSVVAVPTAPPSTCADLEAAADAVVCAHTPEPFVAVGAWYERFEQTTDDEVRELLGRARERVNVR